MKFLFPLILLTFLTELVSAASQVSHTLSYPRDRQQTIFVRSVFPVNAAVTELLLPNWTPGSYLMREFAANLNRISAQSDDGGALAIQKVSKDSWQVNTQQISTLIVNYEISTPKFNVNDSWVSKDFSLINGASIFLYTAQTRHLPQHLTVSASPERGQVFTAMRMTLDGQGFLALDYDELVDSPVVVAIAPVYKFSSKGQDFVFVNVGENDFWDGKKAAEDIEKIVRETQTFWRINPLDKPYWFLNLAVEGRGGLEHDHSTVIMTGRRQMSRREDYVHWLGVVAHEFFHVWNVRHMRPVGLAEIDYQHEQYTRQLWLAEGLTSYYDNLLLSRAGLITPEEFTKLLAKDIHRLETTPGRKVRTVTQASLDAWTRHYKPNDNSVNSTISYYTKGAVIGFVLDAYIRQHNRGRHNLDEVMREMYRRYADKAYEEAAFTGVVADIGGQKAAAFLEQLLNTTAEIDVDDALDWYGLSLDRNPVAKLAELNGDLTESGFGVIWDEDKPALTIKSVLSDSSGAKSGLLPGDELLAIGAERVTADTLSELLGILQPGETATLLLSRRGKIISLDVELEAAIVNHFDIVVKPNFGKRHVNRLQSLLGQDLREES